MMVIAIVFKLNSQNVFTHYPNDAVRVEDQKFKDWDNYKFTLWHSQLNFMVFCASSACGVSVEHLNAKKPMIRSVYRFHVYYQIRRILNRVEIPLPYENSFNKYNNLYNHEKFIKICKEYEVSDKNEDSNENKVSDENEVSCDLKKWRNQRYFATWQSRAWETGKPDVKPEGEGIVKTKPDVKQKRNLTSSPIKNTNKISNLTSISIEKANRMLR